MSFQQAVLEMIRVLPTNNSRMGLYGGMIEAVVPSFGIKLLFSPLCTTYIYLLRKYIIICSRPITLQFNVKL